MADKPRLSIDQIGRFRSFVRLRFPIAEYDGLEDAVMVCAWARAFEPERERRERVLSDPKRIRLESLLAERVATGFAPANYKAEALKLRSERVWLERPHRIKRRAKPQVVFAAQELIELIQRVLREWHKRELELRVPEQHELWFLQQVAVDAWFEVAVKRSHAKNWQKAVSDDRPLTICYDRPSYHFADEGLPSVSGPGGRWGCGRIVPDSREARGVGMFRTRCEGCNGDKRKPELKAHALAKQRAVRHT